MTQSMLCAESAKAAIKGMEAEERAQLRQAGRNKLAEYRQLKAALLQGDLHTALTHATRTTRPATPEPQPQQQHLQQQQQQSAQEGDPMVDVLLAQVSSLMAEKQQLAAKNGSLQRENEQLVELVGFLSGAEEPQQQQDQQEMELGSPVSSSSKEAHNDSWPAAAQQPERLAPALAQMSDRSSSAEAAIEIANWHRNELFSQE